MFKTENQCKTFHVVGATDDDTHVFVQAPFSKVWYWGKQKYSINKQVVGGYDLQFIDIATGFPGSMHNSRLLRHTALYQRAKNNEILLESKGNVNGHQMSRMLLEDGVTTLSNGF